MALIRRFEHKSMERNSVHEEISATYTVFQSDDRAFVQINSYGKKDRQFPGSMSQTIQLDEQAARQLVAILREAFHITD